MKRPFPVLASLVLASVAIGAYATEPANAKSTAATSAKPMQHTHKYCEQQATSKKLDGDARAKFVKECQEAKSK